MREGNHQWLADPNEVEVDYCERYAFEHADIQVSPSRYMFEYARQIGWDARSNARVIPYPYPEPEFVPGASTGIGRCRNWSFSAGWRRARDWKCSSARCGKLDPRFKITFLGRVNTLGNGKTALEYIRENLRGTILYTVDGLQPRAGIALSSPGRPPGHPRVAGR